MSKMIVKFLPEDFDWISDGGLLGEEARYDIFGWDLGDNPIVLNVNFDNFARVCAALGDEENDAAYVQADEEVMEMVLVRL